MHSAINIALDSVKEGWHGALLNPTARQSAMQDTGWADVSETFLQIQSIVISELAFTDKVLIPIGSPWHCRPLRRIVAHCPLLRSETGPPMLRRRGWPDDALPAPYIPSHRAGPLVGGHILHTLGLRECPQADQARADRAGRNGAFEHGTFLLSTYLSPHAACCRGDGPQLGNMSDGIV